ncbi:uncharacterized protein Tco025E_06744 [Trypanosoma conorhini]|uniref:Uncharacterized protein n=1 Tax=Trypanosoma conorhini TaxID=83891 RepID=A0A3R7MSY7_9TRYP|nr:uncharacterized protein Tco025E_06744 [Trypanosoma conorhini]RNF10730.1 hypothetical protein Tco025E_06744 [Trypanosoma conorhini]
MEPLARGEGATLRRNAQGQTITPTCCSFFSTLRRGIVFVLFLFCFPARGFWVLLLCLPSPLWCPVRTPPALRSMGTPASDGYALPVAVLPSGVGRHGLPQRWQCRNASGAGVPAPRPVRGLSRRWRTSIRTGVAWSGRLSGEKRGQNGGARPSSKVAPSGSDATAMVACGPCERPTATTETCRGVGEGADALPRNRREHRTRASTCLARYRPRNPCPVHRILWAWRCLH